MIESRIKRLASKPLDRPSRHWAGRAPKVSCKYGKKHKTSESPSSSSRDGNEDDNDGDRESKKYDISQNNLQHVDSFTENDSKRIKTGGDNGRGVYSDATDKKSSLPSATSFPVCESTYGGFKQVAGTEMGMNSVRMGRDPGTASIMHQSETEESEESSASDSDTICESPEHSANNENAEDSSSDDPQPKFIRPIFLSKKQRDNLNGQVAEDKRATRSKIAGIGSTSSTLSEEAVSRRKKQTDEFIQSEIVKSSMAEVIEKADWDDHDQKPDTALLIDDTDNLDREMEYVEWKLREMKRVKRVHDELVAREKEREEVERRRNLDATTREREDREYINEHARHAQSKGRMGYMQKYFHRGAFFADESSEKRDIMSGRYMDDAKDREALPEYMRIRDLTQLGRKGRSKYKDLTTEDSGSWGRDVTRHNGVTGLNGQREKRQFA